MPPLRVFYSYSSTKAIQPDSVLRVIEVAKDLTAERGWEPVDPMVESAAGRLYQKIFTAIASCDLLVAEVTTHAPNVMLEVGFAMGLQIPTILLVGQSDATPVDDASFWQGYFARFGIRPDKPLPSDIGDIEWQPYPSALPIASLRNQWGNHLKGLLDNLDKDVLSQKQVSARRLRNALQQRLQQAVSAHSADSSLHALVAHLCEVLHHDIPLTAGKLRLRSHHYSSFLPILASWHHPTTAVADLTDDTERFWWNSPEPRLARVSERVFLLSRAQMMDLAQLSEVVKRVLRPQASVYTVRASDTESFDAVDYPLFGRNTLGRNMLLLPPSIVAGYTMHTNGSEDPYKVVLFDEDPARFVAATQAFEQLNECAVPVTPQTDATSLRAAWLKQHGMGRWREDWGPVETRDPSYFSNYSQHIRVWIPSFDATIDLTGNLVMRACAQLMRSESRSLRLLEVGYGTGELTTRILRWVTSVNAPLAHLKAKPLISSYVGVDRSPQMQAAAERAVRAIPHANCRLLVHEVAPFLSDSSEESDFDIIFGTLVLHDILEAQTPTEVLDFLRLCRSRLRPGGSCFFADSFFSPADPQRADELETWREHMRSHGLLDSDIDTFLSCNREMLAMPDTSALEALATEAGFSRTVVRNTLPKSAFRIVEMRTRKTAARNDPGNSAST